MNTRIKTWLSLAVLGALAALPVAAQEVLHARVSFEAGGGMIKGQEDADWSYATLNTLVLPGDVLWADDAATLETEFSGGTFLRLADSSRAEVVSVPPNGVVRAWTGSFYVQRTKRSSGSFTIATPACDVEVHPDSHVRVDIVDEGSTTVTVRWGRATVRTDLGDPVLVTEGRRVYCDVGYLPSPPVKFNRNETDAFDDWSNERARLLAGVDDRVPKEVVTDNYAPIGSYELSSYGDWITVSGRPYWRPTVVVDYVPYRSGHWSYVPAYGYTWIGDYSFCYVTSHYGRWDYHDRYGWIWTYVPGWGPAWVSTVRYDDYYIWTPLNYYNRPVTYGSAHFSIGDFRFSLYGSSYCYTSGLSFGPVVCRPASYDIVRGIHADNVYIWNIYAPNYSRRFGTRAAYSRPVYYGPSSLLRDYSPRRVIRGPDTVTNNSILARSRAVRLEDNIARSSFRTDDRTGGRGVRTAFNDSSRTASVRTARVDSDTMQRTRMARSVRDGGDSSPDGITTRSRVAPLRSSGVGDTANRSASDVRAVRERVATEAAGREAPAGRDDANTGVDSRTVRSRTSDPASNVTGVRDRTVRDADAGERSVARGSVTSSDRGVPVTRDIGSDASGRTFDRSSARVTTAPEDRGSRQITRINTSRTPSASSDRGVSSRSSIPETSVRTPNRDVTTSRQSPSFDRSTATPQRTPTVNRTAPQRTVTPDIRTSTPRSDTSRSSTFSRTPQPSTRSSAPSRSQVTTPNRSYTPPQRSTAPERSYTPSRTPSPAPRSVSPSRSSTPDRSFSSSSSSRTPSPRSFSSSPSRTTTRSIAPSPSPSPNRSFGSRSSGSTSNRSFSSSPSPSPSRSFSSSPSRGSSSRSFSSSPSRGSSPSISSGASRSGSSRSFGSSRSSSGRGRP